MSDRSDEIRPASDLAPAAMDDAHWEALARYIAGESPAVEATTVRAWLEAHPEDAALAAVVKSRSERVAQQADIPVNTDAALMRVRARIDAEAQSFAPPVLRVERGGAAAGEARPGASTAAPRRSWRVVGFAMAAGLAAVAAVGQWRSGNPSGGGMAREYRTQVGQRDSVRLPDGSTVVLAPGSVLTLAANYGAETREVTLEGAAFFDVQHDEGHPFTVHTASADIRDIGTAFSVKTAADGEVAVDVTHGIVALSGRTATAAPVELRAGDRGVLAQQAVTVRRGTVTADDVAWTRGVLSYRDASLAEVRADLQRWYGLDLQVPDSALARRTLTASFRGDSASQVVRVIALALGADVVQHGDTVVLQPQGFSPTPIP